MEYGDDDEEESEFEETSDEPFNRNSNAIKIQKPFWALWHWLHQTVCNSENYFLSNNLNSVELVTDEH